MTIQLLEIWKSYDGVSLVEFFDDAPVMLHSLDAEARIKQVNHYWASKLDYTPAEMVGRPVFEFMTASSREHAASVAWPEFLRTGKQNNVPYEFVRRNGKIERVLVSAIAEQDDNGSFLHSLALISEAKAVAADTQTSVDTIARPLKILFAEDNEINRKVLHAFVSLAPIEASFVENGQQALDLLSEIELDAAIIDIDMPVMNGADAVRLHREREVSKGLPRLPIVACTSLNGYDSINRFMDAGFDHCLLYTSPSPRDRG